MDKDELTGKHIETIFALETLRIEHSKMRDAMERFTRRCEEGSIRSTRTYNEFKDILDDLQKRY